MTGFRIALTAAGLLLASGAGFSPGPFGLPGSEARAQTETELRQTEEKLEAARREASELAERRTRIAAELNSLRHEMILAASNTMEREGLVSRLEQQLESLREEKEARRESMHARNRQLREVLGALVRLSRNPPETLLVRGGPPLETVRSARLLSTAAPTLDDRARMLADELVALEKVETDIGQKLASLTTARSDLTGERARLEALITRQRTLLEETDERMAAAQERSRALAEQATSLRDLLEGIAREEAVARTAPRPPEAPPEPPESPAYAALMTRPESVRAFPSSGQITRPVTGPVVLNYGQDTGFGQTSKGVTIRTRSDAQIVAPFDGRIAFAGPFRDLGRVLIIEHAGGYHTVLAGMSRIDVIVGQWLLAGEPVGVMQMGDTGGSAPELYVELRREGQPVNPLRWISAGGDDTRDTKGKS